jgi:hypothetical protein
LTNYLSFARRESEDFLFCGDPEKLG